MSAETAGISASPGLDLCCITCNTPGMRLGEDMYDCMKCGARVSVVAGIPRFVPAESYSASFGYQWNRFASTQLDSANGTTRSQDVFIEKTGWPLSKLAGKRVLDAGCGMGRFAEVCARAGAEVHAIDLSTAVDAAGRNLAGYSNVRIYQADIMQLPFPESSFDFVYSIGVLHHTPNTRAAFRRLVPLLKPGGAIAIWVYSAKLKLLLGSQILRLVTSKIPRRWLFSATRIAIPLYRIHRLPAVGFFTSIVLPTSMDPDPEWRWLDTFDWYTPRYQHKHSYSEVEDWFRDAGLSDIERGDFPVSVRGVRALRNR